MDKKYNEQKYELYYTDMNINRLREHRLRYLIYGIAFLIISISMFILEFGEDNITNVLDSIISFTMFASMAVSILYIIRSFTLKESIKSDSMLINLTNYSYVIDEDNNINYKKTFSFLRFFGIFITIFNLSLPITYITGILFSEYFNNEVDFRWILATILSIFMVLIPFMSIISLPSERELYNGFKLIEKK